MAQGIIKCSANYIPLTPISFLQRAAIVYRDATSLVYGDLKFTWSQTNQRCLRLASALSRRGISRADVVAVLAPNVPAMYELHFAVPMAGAILCALNTRHDSAMVSVLLSQAGAKLIFVDHQLLDVAEGALKILSEKGIRAPSLVLISDSDDSASVAKIGTPVTEYESLIAEGGDDFAAIMPNDEWDPISLSYTSGTTSNPKGVVYSHRGAYLNTLAAVLLNEMQSRPVYLWTVPMFHCNGWCLAWAMAAQGGTNICLRNVTAKVIFDSIANHGVTHMGGAPTVLNMIVNATASEKRPLLGKVTMMTGGAAPPAVVLSGMEEQGFSVFHCYGMTESCGPATVCTWKPEWDSLPLEARANLKSRQGVQHVGLEEIDIKDPETMQSVPHDGKTMGEVMLRGNTLMSGYLNDLEATGEAFEGGWFHSGDLGVMHPDGYLEVKDRSNDVIISGGKNISTIEVESLIFSHPAVLEAAVVGRLDDHWGETPCAFVTLKNGCSATGQDIINYCRDNLPHYMAPRTVVFEDLPKTSTGKTQKFVLRAKAKAMGSLSAEEVMK